jgi:hypothetical protein
MLNIELSSIPLGEMKESSASCVQFNPVKLDDGDDNHDMAVTTRALQMAEADFRVHIYR